MFKMNSIVLTVCFTITSVTSHVRDRWCKEHCNFLLLDLFLSKDTETLSVMTELCVFIVVYFFPGVISVSYSSSKSFLEVLFSVSVSSTVDVKDGALEIWDEAASFNHFAIFFSHSPDFFLCVENFLSRDQHNLFMLLILIWEIGDPLHF